MRLIYSKLGLAGKREIWLETTRQDAYTMIKPKSPWFTPLRVEVMDTVLDFNLSFEVLIPSWSGSSVKSWSAWYSKAEREISMEDSILLWLVLFLNATFPETKNRCCSLGRWLSMWRMRVVEDGVEDLLNCIAEIIKAIEDWR